MSVLDFTRRIEDRSSLMVQAGFDVEDGLLQPLYEFKHLTFQEYLTALALVEGYYPDSDLDDSLHTIIDRRILDTSWREVWPLAMVLAGRSAHVMLTTIMFVASRPITSVVDDYSSLHDRCTPRVAEILLQCLLDDPQLSPDALSTAIEFLFRNAPVHSPEFMGPMFNSRYRELVVDVGRRLCVVETSGVVVILDGLRSGARSTIGAALGGNRDALAIYRRRDLRERLEPMLDSDDLYDQVSATLFVAECASMLSPLPAQGIVSNSPHTEARGSILVAGGLAMDAPGSAIEESMDQTRDRLLRSDRQELHKEFRTLATTVAQNMESDVAALRLASQQAFSALAQGDLIDDDLAIAWIPRPL